MRVRTMLLGGVAATATGLGLVLAFGGSPVSAADQLAPALAVAPAEASANVERLAAGAPAEQARAFADRRVTRGEYRGAVDAAIDCLVRSVRHAAAQAGIPVTVAPSAPELSGDGFEYRYTYELTVPPGTDVPADAQAQLSAIQVECQARHMDRVAVAYQVQSLAAPSFTQHVADRFVGCLRSAGVDVRAPRSPNQARAALGEVLDEVAADPGSAAADCIQATPAVAADPLGSVNYVLTGSPTG
jgi:hypothetical protein